MANWIEVILSATIVILLLEARINLGVRISLIERDLQWISASLEKWGLIAPKKEDKT